MNDCSNAEIRDRLPDLLHQRLDVSDRAAVAAHVADCIDCREELELLRGVRGILVTQAPQIDVSSVVNALPKPPTRIVGVPTRHPKRVDWRIAAAVGFLLVGGGAVAVMNRTQSTVVAESHSSVPAVSAPVQAVAATRITAIPASPQAIADAQRATPAVPRRASEVVAGLEAQAAVDVAPGGRLADLNERQLKMLLGEIDRLPAVPVTEPEPVAIGVRANTSSSPDGAGS